MQALLTLSNWIGFPALGWEFPLSDVLVEFQLFGTTFTIKWYGLLIAIGFLLAVIYGLKRAKDFDVDPDKMIDAVLVCTLMGFIGARLYYVFFSENAAAYLEDPITILYVWQGGLGIYGGIIFAFLTGILMCRLCKLHFLSMCDLASLGFLIGQAVGRWGNFFNQEAFGGNTTLPWGMTGNIIQAGNNGSDYSLGDPVHPTFLYESLWCILGFVLLHILSKRAYKFKGQLFCGYLVWYGAGRFFIEGLRTDSLMMGTIRASQLVAIVAILLGVVLFLLLRRREQALPKALIVEEENTLTVDQGIITGFDEQTVTAEQDETADPQAQTDDIPEAVSDQATDIKEETTNG